MSLQGPLIVVAETPATELTQALSAAGAFPIVEATWADAPTAFVSVKPAAVIIAEPGPPPSKSSARMLCLQIATASGPIVPTIGLAYGDLDAALPVALPADASLPVARIVARLQSALRVRALHAAVLRRDEAAGAQADTLPQLPSTDALDDATVLIVGRGPLYPALSVAMGERVELIGALSVENAADISMPATSTASWSATASRSVMVDAFLAVLAAGHPLPRPAGRRDRRDVGRFRRGAAEHRPPRSRPASHRRAHRAVGAGCMPSRRASSAS